MKRSTCRFSLTFPSHYRFIKFRNKCSTTIQKGKKCFVRCKPGRLPSYATLLRLSRAISSLPISLPSVIPRMLLFVDHTRKLRILLPDSSPVAPYSFLRLLPLRCVRTRRTRQAISPLNVSKLPDPVSIPLTPPPERVLMSWLIFYVASSVFPSNFLPPQSL